MGMQSLLGCCILMHINFVILIDLWAVCNQAPRRARPLKLGAFTLTCLSLLESKSRGKNRYPGLCLPI